MVDLEMVLSSCRPEYVGGKVNWETGLRQVCEQWKQLASLTHEEIKSLIEDMGVLNVLVGVYMMEEQFDLYTARAEDDEVLELRLDEYKRRIFDALATLLRVFSDVNGWIERERQSHSSSAALPSSG